MPVDFDPRWVVRADRMHKLKTFRHRNADGLDAPFEIARSTDLVVRTALQQVDEAVASLIRLTASYVRKGGKHGANIGAAYIFGRPRRQRLDQIGLSGEVAAQCRAAGDRWIGCARERDLGLGREAAVTSHDLCQRAKDFPAG